VFEATVPRAAEAVLKECRRRGLVVKNELRVKKPMGARHWHVGMPGATGLVELTELRGGQTSIKVASNRDGGWATAFARGLAKRR
jgi:hypothetical protein